MTWTSLFLILRSLKSQRIPNVSRVYTLWYQLGSVKYAAGRSYSEAFTASGLCIFALGSAFKLIDFVSAVTGWDFTIEEAITTGHRIQTLRQAFNAREGLSPKEFSLPKRIAEPPSTGSFAGISVDSDTLRFSYYRAMDWGIQTGWPSEQILSELGLKELV
jgi:aldehyde:ferredoxin oxidoreductase